MTRVLFAVPGRRGLGHVMRGLNLARALRAAEPAVVCRFAARGPAAREVVGGEFGVTVVEDPAADPAEVVGREFAPDVVVHDTALPATVPPTGGPVPVYVMRRALPERQAAVLASPVLARMALIVVPHTEAEFGHPVPDGLRDRCRFVGPIARLPTAEGVAAARRRYAGGAPFLLTSTVGGGGFTAQAQEFFAATALVHAGLGPGVAHVVVAGPNFTGTLPELPGATVVRFDPALVDLLAASDLVVAEGGYNTVTEIRLARTPAVFLPSPRSWDDQAERVVALRGRGLAEAVVGGDPAHRAARVLELVGSPGWRAGVRRAYARDEVRTGNAAAAAAVLSLVR